MEIPMLEVDTDGVIVLMRSGEISKAMESTPMFFEALRDFNVRILLESLEETIDKSDPLYDEELEKIAYYTVEENLAMMESRKDYVHIRDSGRMNSNQEPASYMRPMLKSTWAKIALDISSENISEE